MAVDEGHRLLRLPNPRQPAGTMRLSSMTRGAGARSLLAAPMPRDSLAVMELAEARHLAIAQMKRYQLWRWSFRFSGEKRAFGRCDFGTQTIYLSKHYVLLNEEPQVRDAILHEIAHALAGHEAGHGPKWRRIAARLGAAPRRCVSQDDVTAPPPAYLLECPNCGVRLSRYRRPSQPLACGRCCDRHNGGDYHARFRLQLKRAPA